MAHLNEVAAEGTALDLRLGAPSAYAAELRSAAGYPPAQTQPVAAPWSRAVLLVAAAVNFGPCWLVGGVRGCARHYDRHGG